jgi:hypothetical protein
LWTSNECHVQLKLTSQKFPSKFQSRNHLNKKQQKFTNRPNITLKTNKDELLGKLKEVYELPTG